MGILLTLHIVAGSISLIAATLVVISAKGKRLHLVSGQVFFWGMVVIFLTAIPMAIVGQNLFLFLIAIFSFYLAFAGMRFAKNRKGEPSAVDWVSVGLLFCSGTGMLGLAINYFTIGNSQYITLMVFGVVAVLLSISDFFSHKKRSARGKKRISKHLTNMLAGTIAVITAVLVTNFEMEPAWVLWVLPTVAITPIIFWWNVKTLRESS